MRLGPNIWVPSSFVDETCVSPGTLLSGGSPQQLCSPPPAGLRPRGGETPMCLRLEAGSRNHSPIFHRAQALGPRLCPSGLFAIFLFGTQAS